MIPGNLSQGASTERGYGKLLFFALPLGRESGKKNRGQEMMRSPGELSSRIKEHFFQTGPDRET